MDRKKYLEIVSEQIRCKKALPLVAKELEDHMEDQKMDFMAEGMMEQEAEEAAVQEMGDPVEVGVQMDGIHKPRMPWNMIGLIVAFSVAGYIIQGLLEASVQGAAIQNVSWVDILIRRSAVQYIIGILLMIGICFLDYTWIARHAQKLTMAMTFGIGLMVIWWGTMINGANNWIWVAGISINLSLLIYLFVPLYCAIIYAYRGKGYGAVILSVLWMSPALFFAKTIPSTLTGLTLLLTFLVILSIAVYKNWFKVSKKIVLGGIGAFVLLLPVIGGALVWNLGAEYQKQRLLAMLNPSSTEVGYQMLSLRKLLEGSKMIGQSHTFTEDFAAIPVSQDFVLSYVVSCYGILAAILIVALLAFLIFRFLKISLKQKNQLGMIMGIGCTVVFILQMTFYILSNAGVSVLGGSYCPFLSWGGTGAIVTYVLLGLILSICRYENVLPAHINVTKEFGKMDFLLFKN